ncbi:MAG: hypothetical protein J0H29_02430 [Sphingobacteriales bacterium]|nr:hypothetical protein [Sphingobacteriales bacterium]OJY85685.1 MAG: hypothetical protein BGP14_00655 [Sphingobacteriales bacterium 44-15]
MKFFIHKTCPFRQADTQWMNESRMPSGYGSSPSVPARQPDEAILAGADSWLKNNNKYSIEM